MIDPNRGIDRLEVAGLTLAGVSRGGVETCLWVKELGVMFDVGMCPPGSTRYDHILVSHGHSDHLGGIAYMAGQRSMFGKKVPVVHVPEEIVEPLERIFTAWSEIEGYRSPITIMGHAPGSTIELSRELQATCLRTVHRVPSLAWVVERVSQKLRPEYKGLEGKELGALRRQGVPITQEHRVPQLCVTGDTQIEFFTDDANALARRCRVLVHEVTTWEPSTDEALQRTRRWGHTHLDELVAVAERFEGEALVLVHRSMRHTRERIEQLVDERFPDHLRGKIHVFGT